MKNSNLEIIDHASVINNYLIKLFVDSVFSCAHVPVIAVANSGESAFNPGVTMQFYYNNDTNKCYIEIKINKFFKNQYIDSLGAIKATFTEWLNKNLKRDTTIWPEVIFPEDGKHEICDSSERVTPFTIGYWLSLSGRYTFIEDEIKVLKDYNDMVFPNYGEEYQAKKDQIFDQYYRTDFETFNQKMYELNLTYNIKFDQKPRKDFADFIRTVKAINNAYAQAQLTEEKMSQFIDKYMLLLKNFRNDPEEYQRRLDLLYLEYGVTAELNQLVPEIFEMYKNEYETFFEKELTTFEIPQNAIDHNDNNVEIWTYQGDFDFGSLDEGIDPDTVVVNGYSYDYNKAAEYAVLITYYEIFEKI